MRFALALLITAPLGVLAAPWRGDGKGEGKWDGKDDGKDDGRDDWRGGGKDDGKDDGKDGKKWDNGFQGIQKSPEWFKSWKGRCTSVVWSNETITSTRTMTRKPRTRTSTSRVVLTSTKTVTVSNPTQVFSTTSTAFVTITATQSETTTESVTDTTTINIPANTVTVPTPEGFTPIKSIYPDPLPSPAKRGMGGRGKKGDPVRVTLGDAKCTTTKYKTLTRTKRVYPTTIKSETRPIVTLTRTKTVTSTLTVPLVPASRTETFLTTTTLSESTTSTETKTQTATVTSTEISSPAATVYAACSKDNIMDSYNGKFVSAITYGANGNSTEYPDVTSAYDCCVKCLLDSNCKGAAWLGSTCSGLTVPDTACAPQSPMGSFEAQAPTSNWTISNSGCGQWQLAPPQAVPR